MLLQNQPREVGGILQIRDDDAFDVDAEALEYPVDEVVGERTLLRRLAQKHADDCAHLRFDVDDKDLFIIADKQCAPAVGGENSPDLNRHNIVLHGTSLWEILKNASHRAFFRECQFA